MLTEFRLRKMPCGARIPISGEAPILLSHATAQLPCVVVSSLNMPFCHAAEFLWVDRSLNLLQEMRQSTPTHLALHQTVAMHCYASEGGVP